jgi:hypothetical protein
VKWKTGYEPVDEESGVRQRGASRVAKKGRVALEIRRLLAAAGVPPGSMATKICAALPPGDKTLDPSNLRTFLDGETPIEYDTFVLVMDALIAFGAASYTSVIRLHFLYTEECIAWSKKLRDESGRVSETTPAAPSIPKGTKGTKRTGLARIAPLLVLLLIGVRLLAGEGGFEPPIV